MPTLDSARQRGRRALVRSMRAVVDNDRIPLVAKQLFVMLAAGPYVEPRGGLLRLLGTDSDQTPIESAYGTKFTPDGDNSIVTFWLRFRDVYEPVLSEFLLRHLREGDVCVDAGANIGYFSALLAQRVGPGGKVIAIEAAPGTARLLRKNLQLNGVDAVVEVIEAACAPQRGEMTFYLHPTVDGCSRLTPPAKGDWDHRKGLEWIPVTVQADTLSALVGADADRVSFLKVDVEGPRRPWPRISPPGSPTRGWWWRWRSEARSKPPWNRSGSMDFTSTTCTTTTAGSTSARLRRSPRPRTRISTIARQPTSS